MDEQLKNHLVPFSQRSASKALRTLSRGSKVDLPEGDTIRFFLWWKEGYVNGQHTGRVDIDLSAAMYDEDWQYKEHVSFTNLRSKISKPTIAEILLLHQREHLNSLISIFRLC